VIFGQLEKLFQEDSDFAFQKEDKLKSVLKFSLAISIEYKMGYLNSTNLDLIKSRNNLLLLSHLNVNEIIGKSNENKIDTEKKVKYDEIFFEKYYTDKVYHFYESVFNSILGISPLIIDKLKKELNEIFISVDGQLPEQDLLLRELAYLECLKISNQEYRKKTYRILKFVEKGKYQLQQYGTAFHYISRFNNLLNFDFDKLKRRFKKGISKGIAQYKYSPRIGFEMSVSNEIEFKDNVLEIIHYCISVNDSLKKAEADNDTNEVFKMFESDFDKFEEAMLSNNNEVRFTPFWLSISVFKVYRIIRKLKNDEIWRLAFCFEQRYKQHIYEKLIPEKKFIEELLSFIDNDTKTRKKKSLRNASLDFLSSKLRSSLENFPPQAN
jgi:hypothetical protein